MSKSKTLEQYINGFNNVHGKGTYDYSLIKPEDIINSKSKVIIICLMHGKFIQTINNHMSGNGCIECKKIKLGNEFRKSVEFLIKEFNNVHGQYDYSLVNKDNYKNNKSKIPIICHEKDDNDIIHGLFYQTVGNHKQGHGCTKCKIEKQANLKRNSIDKIVEILEEIYGKDKFDFSLISEENYKNNKSKIPIICKEHGIFYKTLTQLNRITNCPKCLIVSKMEVKTENWLKENNYVYILQKKFNNCKGIKHLLPFDFYIPNLNTCVECDGVQHFKPVQFGGITWKDALKNFEITKINDSIKTKYCLDNSINLIRISYEDNLVEKLNEYVGGK